MAWYLRQLEMVIRGETPQRTRMRCDSRSRQGRIRDAAKLLHTSRSTLYAYLEARRAPPPEVERTASTSLG